MRERRASSIAMGEGHTRPQDASLPSPSLSLPHARLPGRLPREAPERQRAAAALHHRRAVGRRPRPTPLGPVLEIHGRFKEVKGRKVIVEAKAAAAGVLAARGEVVAVRMPGNFKARRFGQAPSRAGCGRAQDDTSLPALPVAPAELPRWRKWARGEPASTAGSPATTPLPPSHDAGTIPVSHLGTRLARPARSMRAQRARRTIHPGMRHRRIRPPADPSISP